MKEHIAEVFEHSTRAYTLSFYEYYWRKGYQCVVWNGLLGLLFVPPCCVIAITRCSTHIFLILVFLFVFGCVDYRQMASHFEHYVCRCPLHPSSRRAGVPGQHHQPWQPVRGRLLWEPAHRLAPPRHVCCASLVVHADRCSASGFIWLFTAVFALMTLYQLAVFVNALAVWREIKHIYNTKLHIADEQLESLSVRAWLVCAHAMVAVGRRAREAHRRHPQRRARQSRTALSAVRIAHCSHR